VVTGVIAAVVAIVCFLAGRVPTLILATATPGGPESVGVGASLGLGSGLTVGGTGVGVTTGVGDGVGGSAATVRLTMRCGL